MNQVGEFGLLLACLAAWGAALTAVLAIWFNDRRILWALRGALAAAAGFLTVSSVALLRALVASDFSLKYVVEHSERSLPVGYKIAAFWAGQQGSILLWGWLVAVMGVIAVIWWGGRREDRTGLIEEAVTGLTLAAVVGFFAALMVFVEEANPFATFVAAAIQGRGLNPLLRNVAMIAHPPTLFIGYAGCTVPFAMLCGVLVSGRADNGWLVRARPWVILSWVALTVGIILGSWWAYVELSWGGYWAWDPVENGSLLPWLTSTALLHSLLTQQRRGMFKGWVAALMAQSFILCLVGTFVTRSGVIFSVHSFEKSLIGMVFLWFLVAVAAVSIGLIIGRWRLLKAERPLADLLSREGFVLAGNVLLEGMMLCTLGGTLMPALTAFLPHPITVDKPFFNVTVLSQAIVLAGLMGMGPLLSYGAGAWARSWRAMTMAGCGAVVGAVLGALYAVRHQATAVQLLWAMGAAAVVGEALAGVVTDYVLTVRNRMVNVSQGMVTAGFAALGSDHQRWGAQVAHVGMALLVLGIAGSSLFSHSQKAGLMTGQAVEVPGFWGSVDEHRPALEQGGYTLTYEGVRMFHQDDYQAQEAAFALRDAGGQSWPLKPERRLYDSGPEQWYGKIAYRPTLGGDVYVNLAGVDPSGAAIIEVIINPLVNWIWLGGVLLTLGGLVCLVPRRGAVGGPAGTGGVGEAAQDRGFPVVSHVSPPLPVGPSSGRRSA